MRLLDGKTCIITGGAGSVGLAAARMFQEAGARLVLVDIDKAAVEAAAHAIGGDVIAHAGDVASAEAVEASVAAAIATFGALDVVFSNAGNFGHIAPVADYDDDAFDRTMRIHAGGAYLVCKHAARRMADGGSIVVTSSLAGVRGGGGQNLAYVAAKHAQVGIVRAAARGLAPRIRVNAINPGPVDNGFQIGIEQRMGALSGADVGADLDRAIPLRRHARPDEIASVALFLASGMSSYITGAVHMVDGGMMS